MRIRVALLLAVLSVNCSGIVLAPHPTPEHPLPMCVITCGRGATLQFARQHLCAGGASRLMQDVLAIGEHVERNVDGTVKLDDWITKQGDYPKVDVEAMACSSYVAQLIATRPAEQRGAFPGERPDGTPDH